MADQRTAHPHGTLQCIVVTPEATRARRRRPTSSPCRSSTASSASLPGRAPLIGRLGYGELRIRTRRRDPALLRRRRLRPGGRQRRLGPHQPAIPPKARPGAIQEAVATAASKSRGGDDQIARRESSLIAAEPALSSAVAAQLAIARRPPRPYVRVSALHRLALLPDAAHRFDLFDVRRGQRHLARRVAHVDRDFADLRRRPSSLPFEQRLHVAANGDHEADSSHTALDCGAVWILATTAVEQLLESPPDPVPRPAVVATMPA